MCLNNLYLLPIAFVVLLPVTFLITYAIAVSDDDVAPFFPFISDTGTLPPESCIFGQLLNIAAVLILVVIYLRYKQIAAYISITRSATPSSRANIGFFILGLLSGFGLSIVGNFQVENSKGIHIFGAVLAFIVGGAYFFTQTYISWIFRDIPGSSSTKRVTRLVICILYASFVIIGIVTFVLSKSKLGKEKISTRLWTSDYKGYPEHVVSSVVEWLGSFLICVFVATFIPEFKHLRLETKWQLELATGELQPVV
ncbi:DNA damage-regulated autophagy modulator protein 2-like [Saccostrea echinata]|uniref:DNA damage-regulated autophagy modulator protein 2-like n=1 Tax=Saccostrea echinata TaxID=191078 RepID=UPI002A8154FE|nr:DNA damage-regulated autophagy modulator protein 2-like [Saccostrea echinata]